MKRRLKLILVSTMILSMLPIQVFAENVNVGVEITNVPTIDVITTISSNVIVDVQNRTNYPAYLKLQNKSRSPIEVYVSDVEALDTDIPTTFLDYNSTEATDLTTAGVTDTKSKIAFGIETDYNNYISVQPDTSTLLDTIEAYLGGMGSTSATYSYENITYNYVTPEQSTRIYPLKVKTGYAWDESKVLNYSITMIVGLAENDTTSDVLYSEKLGTDITTNVYLSAESTKAIIELSFLKTETNSDGFVGMFGSNNHPEFTMLTFIETVEDEIIIDLTTNETITIKRSYYYIDLADKTDCILSFGIAARNGEGGSEHLSKVIHIQKSAVTGPENYSQQ